LEFRAHARHARGELVGELRFTDAQAARQGRAVLGLQPIVVLITY
jgi:hypothetical protein